MPQPIQKASSDSVLVLISAEGNPFNGRNWGQIDETHRAVIEEITASGGRVLMCELAGVLGEVKRPELKKLAGIPNLTNVSIPELYTVTPR